MVLTFLILPVKILENFPKTMKRIEDLSYHVPTKWVEIRQKLFDCQVLISSTSKVFQPFHLFIIKTNDQYCNQEIVSNMYVYLVIDQKNKYDYQHDCHSTIPISKTVAVNFNKNLISMLSHS